MSSSFSRRVRLDVPADAAFAVLADPSSAPVIDPAVVEYRPDPLPMRVGTVNAIRLRVAGVRVRATSRVTEWEPGRRMVMTSQSPSRPVTVTATHQFEPDGSRCWYTWSIVVEPVGLLGRPAAPVVCRFLRANAEAQQVRFAQEVVRRSHG